MTSQHTVPWLPALPGAVHGRVSEPAWRLLSLHVLGRGWRAGKARASVGDGVKAPMGRPLLGVQPRARATVTQHRAPVGLLVPPAPLPLSG